MDNTVSIAIKESRKNEGVGEERTPKEKRNRQNRNRQRISLPTGSFIRIKPKPLKITHCKARKKMKQRNYNEG
jgi:hypothetical protein